MSDIRMFSMAHHCVVPVSPAPLPEPPYGWEWLPVGDDYVTQVDGDWCIVDRVITLNDTEFPGCRMQTDAGPVEFTAEGWFEGHPMRCPDHYVDYLDGSVEPEVRFTAVRAREVHVTPAIPLPRFGVRMRSFRVSISDAADYAADREAVSHLQGGPVPFPVDRAQVGEYRPMSGHVVIVFDPATEPRHCHLVVFY